MACFRASGENFDVDAFLATTTLKPDLVFRRGEPKPPRPGKETRLWKASGFVIEIGGVFGRLLPQISESVLFLEACQKDLRTLPECLEISDVRLIFSYSPGTAANVCEYLPPNLMLAVTAIGAGIEFDVYSGEDSWIDKDYGEIGCSWKGPTL